MALPLKRAIDHVKNGQVEHLQPFMNELSSFINDCTQATGYETLLYKACDREQVQVLKLLLQVKGIDVNKGSKLNNYNISHPNRESYVFIRKNMVDSRLTLAPLQVYSPLYIACKHNHLEIIQLLLSHPNIRIDHRATNIAMKEHCIDLNLLSFSIKSSSSDALNDTSQRSFIYAKFYSYQHLQHVSLVNKYDRDTLFENSNIIVFKPLIKLMAPSFYKKVLKNKELILSLDHSEEQIVQHMINSFIYGGPSDLLSIMNVTDQSKSSLTLLETLKLCIQVVFIVNQVVNGECTNWKVQAVRAVVSVVKFENILDTLDLIQTLLEREHKYFKSRHEFENSNTSTCTLRKIKEYCLDYIGTNAWKDEGYDLYVEKDPRMQQYAMSVIKRREMKPQNIYETPCLVSNTLFFDLYHGGKKTDFEMKLMSGKVVKCHKTMLSSKNSFFEGLFSGNWSLDLEEKYGDEMEYIVQYCYGFVEQVPQHLIVPLIKKAHEHEMNDLVEVLVRKELILTLDNFAQAVEDLYDYMEEPIISNTIFKFASQNRISLWDKVDPNLLHPKLQLCLATGSF
ncbi:hypothetical protein C9374_005517 [Naegleria lovaniensis]|uniref:BTB domain-containing protein n=1 Tax=Naegleria lovaniensis TaxID=51637 RepID=A0AA88GLA7_NAELO|nr:uncharacterized protein C9374_005517 [Naegleria lovaniensis]KAG2382315.1 hypothetical protein C9374_005517 [Naegleria lovaniensis]